MVGMVGSGLSVGFVDLLAWRFVAGAGDAVLIPQGVPHTMRFLTPSVRLIAVFSATGERPVEMDRYFLAMSEPATSLHLPAPATAETYATAADPAQAARLASEIKETLLEAIAAGGSSLRDYVQPDGELGYFQHAWRVYGREGERCQDCPGPPCPGVSRIVQAGRSTFYCPRLQA